MSKKINYLVVIPARFRSKRLPGKPLMDICGKPMIIRTFDQCRKVFPSSKIIVATDDKRIKNVCEENNIRVVMTSKYCLTGTDRMAEVAKKIKANFYLNVQGDEPMCNISDLKKLFKAAKKSGNTSEVENILAQVTDLGKQIEELGYLFKNIEGCNLKKTSTNFVNFYGNINSKLLIIDSPPDIDEDKTGISFVSKKGEYGMRTFKCDQIYSPFL